MITDEYIQIRRSEYAKEQKGQKGMSRAIQIEVQEEKRNSRGRCEIVIDVML